MHLQPEATPCEEVGMLSFMGINQGLWSHLEQFSVECRK